MDARGGRGRVHGHGRGAPMNPPPPPPVTMEQLMGMQAQLMEAMMQHLDNEPARGLPPVQVRDKHGEFMKGRPPISPMPQTPWRQTIGCVLWKSNLT